MKRKIIEFINSLPGSVQFLLALVFLSKVIFTILFLCYMTGFYTVLLIPVYKVMLNFALTPIFSLSGLIDYKMPLFIVVRNFRGEFELHNGTIYDMIISVGLKDKAFNIKRKIIYNYLRGLLNIISDIERKKFSPDSKFVGFTHVVDDKSAIKFGFAVKKIPKHRQFMFLMDFLNLSLLLSFAKQKPSFPNLRRLKRIEITGENLLRKKTIIEQYINLFEKPAFEVRA